MNHLGHEIRRCACGAIIAQCRCPDPNKTTRFVQSTCERCTRVEVFRDCNCPEIADIDELSRQVNEAERVLRVAQDACLDEEFVARLKTRRLYFRTALQNAVLEAGYREGAD